MLMDIVRMCFGQLADLSTLQMVLLTGGLFTFLLYYGLGRRFLFAATYVLAVLFGIQSNIFWTILAVLTLLLGSILLRRHTLSRFVCYVMTALKLLPQISQTEQEAIDAGTVWVDRDLFSGSPNMRTLMSEPYAQLTDAEQAFMAGPVETLCNMMDDWQVYQNRDLPPEVWDFLKKEKFFGLSIPTKYGGLGFSPLAHGVIVSKLTTCSVPLAITAMVPNSLGPAELLYHYGTEEQKDHYLPRLADGRELPCFALTEPEAGSDAGAMSSEGVVFKDASGDLKLRLNWKKRWITLAAISTVMGVAFRLRDPDNLLGQGEDVGISCALVPSNTPGVELGLRHDPIGVPFFNCPTEGQDVEVGLDALIGGLDWAGQGWRMLMESLAAGRGISLPSLSAGATKKVARVVGAYSHIREQFGVSVGKFEGVAEPLGRVAGYAYLLDAMLHYTCGAIANGAKPPVITAMAKYNATEFARKAINDGMDILGGAGISRGPRNVMAHLYQSCPIGVTVEGANILTRTLVVFGQGAIRCHPFILGEIEGIKTRNLRLFDQSFWGHIAHVCRNGVRALVLSATYGLVAGPFGGRLASYKRRLKWASASFAFLSDIALGTLGASLKRREMLTGRFADILSWMFMLTAVLRRYEFEGRPKEDLPYVDWACETAFHEMQMAFDGLFQNMAILRPFQFWNRLHLLGHGPSDDLLLTLANSLHVPGAQRDRLTPFVFCPKDEQKAEAKIERAFRLICDTESDRRLIKRAMRKGTLTKQPVRAAIVPAKAQGLLSDEAATKLAEAETARYDVIQVDAFPLEDYLEAK